MNSETLAAIPFFTTVIFGNSLSAWVSALVSFLTIYLVLKAVKLVLVRQLKKQLGLKEEQLPLDLIQASNGLVILIVAFSIGALFVKLPEVVDRNLKTVLIIALIIQGGVWLSKLVTALLTKHLCSKGTQDATSLSAISLVTFVSQIVIWAIVALLVLENLNIDVTALVAGLGIGGIAVALAVQNILGDLLASLSIVLDRPFVVGDFIIVNDVMGSVEKIGIKTTRVRSLSGEQIVFPNSDLLGSRVRNFKRMFERRIIFTVGVVYNTPEEKVRLIPTIIREAIEAQEPIRVDRVHFKGFGDFALLFEAVYFVLAPEYLVYMDIQQEINLIIYRRFSEEGIEFAYPTQTLFLEAGNKPFLTTPVSTLKAEIGKGRG